jgi:hypothetical protein
MLRFVVRRFGFLSIVLWTLLVIDLAVLALLVVSLGACSGEDPPEPGARGSAIEGPPGSSTPADGAADARPQGRPIPRTGEGDAAGPAASPEEPAGPGEAPLLCGPQEALIYSWRERVAVAADRVGHFTLYGGADPRSGRPTGDSYDLLRDCSPELSFANSTTLRVDGGEPEFTGAESNVVGTREAESGAITTVYHFGGGIEMTQNLRLVKEEGPGGPELEIYYRLANRADEPRTVGLRSLLNPPIWAPAPDRPVYRAPVIAERPLQEGGRKNGRIVTERTMIGRNAQAPFYVPRRGAASDSSARWEPGNEGPPPERITFAGSLGFLGAPFLYEARLGHVLPPNSAFAAYWTGLRLEPGQELTLSHRYVTHPAPGASPGGTGGAR